MANAILDKEYSPVIGFSSIDEESEIESIRPQSHSSKSSSKSSRTPRASQKELDALREDDTAGLARQRPVNTSATCTATESTLVDDTVVRIPLTVVQEAQDKDDVLSILPSERERCQLLGDDISECNSRRSNLDSDSDENDIRFRKYSSKSNNLLEQMFRADATTKSDKSSEGISLDNSQISVLKDSWRTENPSRLSAYKDSYKAAFPVSEETEDMLTVPSLGSIVSNLLIKKYGQKLTIKSQSLCSQPLKDLEKIAYQGQHAARMGIIINVYMQQALGKLLSTLSDKECKIDCAIQCVRDIFAMNAKSLDQAARSGALHHMIRRKAAMADTGLNESKDLRNHVWNLPLSHEGIFGTGLDRKLKERQEINQQISDLLPEFDKRTKRKMPVSNDQPWKRPRYQDFASNYIPFSFNSSIWYPS
ncbi:hypothetical protein ACF0H5_002281 [Mactra antiquata]